ncbi:hypothetical protein THRCLA_08543 [Thraustotheca clavata]|uniref:Uncharacterized protein n=1 Tax=Thraustotheca clavata TaxID=74557 RepID=A0A1V9Z541_9STRA|nr:hypothetical protein THRCLA_08543 [Thraustotheca clavata]
MQIYNKHYTNDLDGIYADTKCFGFNSGTSNIQISYSTFDGMSPAAILARIIGGRLPKTDYPSHFLDMIAAGTQASIVITKANGSEATILNFIALLSLVWYRYFFIRISIYLYHTAQWVRKMPRGIEKDPMLYSIVNCSISSVIWTHYRSSMTFIGFLGLIAYHLRASNSSCQWDDSMANIIQDAFYTCKVNIFGSYSSAHEIVRLFSYSWVFYGLVFMDRMPVPFSVLTIFVAEVCYLHLQAPTLFLIHNHLFLYSCGVV